MLEIKESSEKIVSYLHINTHGRCRTFHHFREGISNVTLVILDYNLLKAGNFWSEITGIYAFWWCDLLIMIMFVMRHSYVNSLKKINSKCYKLKTFLNRRQRSDSEVARSNISKRSVFK